MRAPLIALALFTLDAALFWGVRNLSREKDELTERLADLIGRLESARTQGVGEKRVRDIVERASSVMNREAEDIASLRDLLIGAERGLDIDRFSLDFRSERGGASRAHVGASLGGTFEAVYGYLERVEALRLPLAPEAVSLREELSGRISISAQWVVPRSTDGGARPDFSTAEVGRLDAWLARKPEPGPGRDPFSPPDGGRDFEDTPSVAERGAFPEDPESVEAPMAAAPEPMTPRLAGFVLARPELESDVDRRVLAALRFEGGLILVGVGEQIGDFRVETIEARESVTLIHLETGEPLTLLLE